MRVLHVIARMNVGGTATYLHSLITGLSNLGVSTSLAVGQVPINESEDSRLFELEFFRIKDMTRSINPIKDFKAAAGLNQIVKEFKPDIIHSHTFKAGLISRATSFGVPNIHTFHGHHFHDPEFGTMSRWTIRMVEKILARRSTKLITIGTRVGNELLFAGIGEKSQYVSIPPGIKVPVKIDRKIARAKFGFQPSDSIVVWMGRFTSVKRPDLAVEVANRMSDLIFLMAGDGELLGEVKNGAKDNVRFMGIQQSKEMWALADLGLLTSESEGMPLSAIEAQMYGVPIVATDVGSVSEIVEDGVTGILVLKSASDIELAIREILDNQKKMTLMRKAARARAHKLFSQDIMVRSHLRLYDEILGKVGR